MKRTVNLPLHQDLGNAAGLAIDARVRLRNLQHWQKRHFHQCLFTFVLLPAAGLAILYAYDTFLLAQR